jgi:hypothetical protein
VIAVDTNVLVYAHRPEFPKHTAARSRLTALAEADAPWGLPVFAIGEFLRVITHPRLLDPPHTPAEASEAISRVLASPSLIVLYPGDRYTATLLELVIDSDVTGNLVFDAMIVAVCREHGVHTLLTEDRDFNRFDGLAVEHLEA